MKKYFLSLVAMAAAMLFATSCQESLVEPQVGGPTTFTIEIPGQMGTKAGDNSYKLFVEVYSEDGNTKIHRLEDVITVGDAKTVSLNLVATQVYDIIFWAQKADASYDARNLNKVEITNKHHNSENGAAFYAIKNDYKPVEVNNPSVTLKRPFAQLNIGTIDEVSYGDNNGNKKLEILSTKIKVESAAKYFERINTQDSPELGEGTTEVVFEYEGGNVLTSTMTIGEGANAKTYKQVSMDYISVLGNRDAVTVTATIKVKDPNGVESTIERVITNVPLQMNYRTNIVGNLITSTSDFTVTIDEGWGGTDINKEVVFREVATAAELEKAIIDEVDNITLTENIELTKTLVFGEIPVTNPIARASATEEPSSYVLDLNGKTITTAWENESAGKHHYAFTNYANLTIKGNGTINARGIFNYGVLTLENGTINAIDGNGGYAVRNYEGEFIMNGGTVAAIYEDNDDPEPGNFDATAIRVDPGAKAVINGGNVNNVSNFTVAIENHGETMINGGTITSVHSTVANYANAMTINGGSFICNGIENVSSHVLYVAGGTVEIKGGTFDGKDNDNGYNVYASAGSSVIIKGGKFLPVHSGSLYGEGTIRVSGGTFFDNPSEKRLEEGYRISKKDGWYVVEPITVEVSTADELVAALENNQNVIFANDIKIDPANMSNGYGKTGINVKKGQAIDGNGSTLEIKGASGNWDSGIGTTGGLIKNITVKGSFRGIFMPGAKDDVFIDNVTFENVTYTFNSDAGNKNYGVYISNSTLNGWTSFSNAHKEVVFTNCTFGEGSGNAFCRPYNACVFENCEFSTDMQFDTSKVANIVFINCTYGGVKITAENAASLKTGEVTFFYNGVGSVHFE